MKTAMGGGAGAARLVSEGEAGVRVLVADSNRPLAENVAELFTMQCGVVADLVGTAKEARVAFETDSPDIVLLDVQLPDESGVRVAQEFKRKNPECTVILITSQTSVDTAVEAVRHGVYDYVQKPFLADELVALVRRALADVRLRRKTQALARRLEMSESVHRGVVESVEALILGVDGQGTITFANRVARELLSSDNRQVEGMALDEVICEADDRPWFRRALGRAASGTSMAAREFATPSLARVVRWKLTPLASRCLESSAPGMAMPTVLAVGLDVTAHRALESRTARSEAMARMGELATGLAHELRNPLNTASLQLEVLGRSIDSGRADTMDEARWAKMAARVEIVKSELGRLSGMVNEFIELARPIDLERQEVVLGPFIHGLLARIETSTNAAQISVEVDIDSPVATVSIDEERLSQALLAVLENAVSASEKRIGVRTRFDEAGVTFVIEDDGPGFSSSPAELVEPFFTTKPAGSGLGLALVDKIVRAHGAELHFGRSGWAGARVAIKLPKSSES